MGHMAVKHRANATSKAPTPSAAQPRPSQPPPAPSTKLNRLARIRRPDAPAAPCQCVRSEWTGQAARALRRLGANGSQQRWEKKRICQTVQAGLFNGLGCCGFSSGQHGNAPGVCVLIGSTQGLCLSPRLLKCVRTFSDESGANRYRKWARLLSAELSIGAAQIREPGLAETTGQRARRPRPIKRGQKICWLIVCEHVCN
ncbi:hypothetical protein FN846DRAFT_966021 [Sphaerosporella brunnea]|uniref:Uncharacterized protein n=1 Tax=Sphaerosporella brunnea TaxID=1250544 RepID=A0A5J5EMB1_9PEZI|nr:hypothetical protein FN846DRAFT_966021 [Sphaerosporella brunnea]